MRATTTDRPDQHAGTRRRTQDERRATAETALLDAASALVVESGVGSLTLARVGERAGYSRGIVTHHFGSKQALVDALARRVQAGYVTGLDAMAPGLERLLALVEGYVALLSDATDANRAFLLLWVEAASAPELTPIFVERDAGFRAELCEDLAAGLADGTVAPDVDPADTAVAVVGQLRGIALQRLVDPAAVDADRLARVVAVQWRRALTGGAQGSSVGER